MAENFDIGARVRVKETSSKYAGETGMILKLGMGNAHGLDDLKKVDTSWLVELGGKQEDMPERYLELISESEI
jgi:hypothetical protein